MPQNKRLHFKDLDGLRFLAFIPVFIFSVLFLSSSETEGFHVQLIRLFRFIKINSFDFYFFLSAFLLTSLALREYKYKQSFSLKSFYARRLVRLAPLAIMALVFAFVVYPMIIETLKLTEVKPPEGPLLLQLIPEYYATYQNEQYIYLSTIWVIIMFSEFYLIWGMILKFGKNHLKTIALILIISGIASRQVCYFLDCSFEFNPLSYGVAIGAGTILAMLIRNESPRLDRVKTLPKKMILPIYVSGLVLIIFGYLISTNFFVQSIIPLFTSSFFGFLLLDQTFGKNAPFKFRNNKLISHLGKISFGLFVYQSILNVLIVIGIDSLDFELNSIYTKVLMALLGFAISWIVADLSYNYLEKPLLRLRREFKKA